MFPEVMQSYLNIFIFQNLHALEIIFNKLF